jgi:glutathione S-transferase
VPVKLCFSPTSPYVRKVRACAISREIDGQIELVPTDANASLAEFVAINPLSKVPALVTEDGVALFDSPVICEYLDNVGDALPMFPSHGAARWRALKFQAMGDDILDASVPRRGEMRKPHDEGRVSWIARQKAAVDRTLDALEADPPLRTVDIGSITVACALGYLDFRYPAQP